MKFLDMILVENELNELKTDILSAYKQYKINNKKLLKEMAGNPAVTDISGDLDYVFDEAKKRFAAAKRAVSIANKLNDPVQKQRVWSNLNMLRAFVKNLTKQVEAGYEQILHQAKGSNSVVSHDVRNFTHGMGQETTKNPNQGQATGIPPRQPQGNSFR